MNRRQLYNDSHDCERSLLPSGSRGSANDTDIPTLEYKSGLNIPSSTVTYIYIWGLIKNNPEKPSVIAKYYNMATMLINLLMRNNNPLIAAQRVCEISASQLLKCYRQLGGKCSRVNTQAFALVLYNRSNPLYCQAARGK